MLVLVQWLLLNCHSDYCNMNNFVVFGYAYRYNIITYPSLERKMTRLEYRNMFNLRPESISFRLTKKV